MSNPKHSPLPWATDGQELRDAKGELIGMTYSDGNNLRDAEFIVRAANAHGALVSALETAEPRIAEHPAIRRVARSRIAGNFPLFARRPAVRGGTGGGRHPPDSIHSTARQTRLPSPIAISSLGDQTELSPRTLAFM